ncbi:39S ribosomal protein L4, mitochondrial-like [Trichosurus vulpecula]|uniref:39S ribosomal protein L4, mitochondrial-like n=1 Tax=Trichosurus vulpecula TaxID=9337 RepID=UPI00186B13C2|nr:39S ribosomal protein L4, mitochondrial-like [Trichosurus vulpecula]
MTYFQAPQEVALSLGVGTGAALLLIWAALGAWEPGQGLTPARRALSTLTGEDLTRLEHVLTTGPPSPTGVPLLHHCDLPVPMPRTPVQAWVESLWGYEETLLGLADLHPNMFAVPPRLDILHEVAIWQKNLKRISYAKAKIRAEVRGGGKKPWKQKDSGQARHGSIHSPIWRGGGIAHGPRGPTSYYYMLPMKIQVLGLRVTLTVKLMQDDLHVVDSLELPTSDPRYLLDLVRHQCGGDSVLLVDVDEEMPQNIVSVVSDLKTINLGPAVGLNVHSMLKHQTLVLTLNTVAFLEKKLLWHDKCYTAIYPFRLPYSDFP